ncbi:hypothetical protein U5640_36250 [Streptomyces sp. SS7]|uniref:hypothetical protein n=1 Tax=Streptomyces sp. SS7 TaxID=3108485 RepID=UPI0030EDF18E
MKPIHTPAPAAPAPGGPRPARAASPVPVVREPFDRHAWEAEVIASSLHRATRHIAFVLAHFAGDTGYLPPGGPQHLELLTAATGHNERNCRLSLQQLENARFISRPPVGSWKEHRVRPVTLTMPPDGFRYRPHGQDASQDRLDGAGARRTEPAHPGRAAS